MCTAQFPGLTQYHFLFMSQLCSCQLQSKFLPSFHRKPFWTANVHYFLAFSIAKCEIKSHTQQQNNTQQNNDLFLFIQLKKIPMPNCFFFYSLNSGQSISHIPNHMHVAHQCNSSDAQASVQIGSWSFYGVPQFLKKAGN